MQWVETTGKTTDDAKQAALAELGVAEPDAEIVVVTEPKPGLFGRVRGDARVRARVRPAGPPSKNGRRRGRGRDERPGRSDESARPGRSDESARPGRSDESARPTRSDKARNGRSRPEKQTVKQEGDAPVRDEQQADEVEIPLEEQGEVAAGFVEGVIENLGLEASVTTAVVDEDTVRVAVDGDDLGLLIGPRGQALDALQDLTRTTVFRQTGARHGWVVVDVNDYRAKRRSALEKFTQGVAAEVVDGGERRSLEPMNPADRKIVHDTVNDIAGVRTSSEGEEPRRYVVISPSEAELPRRA